MFDTLLRSLSGSLVELTQWEATGDRVEVEVRNGLEKSLLFTLCAAAMLSASSATLGITQQSAFCDRGLAFWNGFAAAMLLAVAISAAAALFFDTKVIKLASRLISTNCESSPYEHGNTALILLSIVAGGPLAIIAWTAIGYVNTLESPTCRSTAALLYGGTITNMCLILSALIFAALMTTYFVVSAKGFYDIAILKCICDPAGVVVDAVSQRMPDIPESRMRIPYLDEVVARLPTYEDVRSLVKRIVQRLAPKALPERINAIMEARIY